MIGEVYTLGIGRKIKVQQRNAMKNGKRNARAVARILHAQVYSGDRVQGHP